VIRAITHGINLVRHAFRDVGVSAKRSSHWPTVEKHFREGHSTCAACGSKKRLNVHHIRPFHMFPELELDPTNLITLCMSTTECHFRLGHLSNWHAYNGNIREDAAEVLAHPSKYDAIVKKALANRLVN